MSDSSLPQVNDPYVRRVFDSLSKMDVDLDSDPMMYGPKRMIAKVALCRDHLSRCQQIFLQVSDDLHRLNRAHRKAKLDFDLQMQDLLANDPDVRAGKNVRDREAVATMKLRSDREEIANIESSIQDLEAVMSVVKAKREDLKDIQGRIRDQVKLCQEEIGLGGKWGSAPPPGARTPNLDAAPKVDRAALETLNEVMGGLEGESSVSDLEQFVMKELAGQVGQVGEEDDHSEEAPAPTPVKSEPVKSEPAVEVKATPVQPAAPAPAPVQPAAPVVEEAEDPLGGFLSSEEEPETHLPNVEAKPEPSASTSTSPEEIDNFFNDLDVDAPAPAKSGQKAATAAPPPLSNDIDLDDLIGTFK